MKTIRLMSPVLLILLMSRFAICQTDPANHLQRYEKAIAASRVAAKAMLTDSQTPGCQVAVCIDGKVVWTEGFGLSDLEHQTPVTSKTKFGIGSITKSFTCALMMRLADEKKCDVDKPIKSFLATFPYDESGITPRSVATHLSGLDDAFSTANRYNTRPFKTTEEALKEIFRDKLVHAPGERLQYATGSYTLLAGVIEEQTGQPFLNTLRQQLIEPLGLSDTTANDPIAIISHRTRFYEQNSQTRKIENSKHADPSYKMAGAGLLSTASDVAQFADAVLFGRYLSEDAKRALLTNYKTNDGKPTGFGMGWRIAKDSDGRDLYHQPGGGPGISSWVFVYPKEKMTFVFLSNLTSAPIGGNLAEVTTAEFLNTIK